MKTSLITFLICLIASLCEGAGLTVSTTNGVAVNLNVYGTGNVLTTNMLYPSVVVYPSGVGAIDSSNLQVAIYSKQGTSQLTVVEAPGIFSITTNIWMTNNVTLVGYGATNNVLTTLLGFPFNFATNMVNVGFDGIIADGGFVSSQWGTLSSGVTNIASYLPATIGFGFANHSGFYINMGGGGFVRNCQARGFSGFGFYMINTKGGTAYSARMTTLYPNIANDNYIGAWICGGFYDDGFGTFAAFSSAFGAEYTAINGWNFYNNSQGLGFGSGNARVVNCTFANNFVGAATVPASNSGHGLFENNTVNHNHYSMLLTGLGTGEVVQGNTFLANNLGMLIDSPTGLEIKHNKFDNTGVFLKALNAGTSPNYFIYNSYQGIFQTNKASGFSLNGNWDGVTNQFYGNYSSDTPDNTDGRLVGLAIQTYSTNATLVSATSLQVFFTPGFAVGDSNYIVTAPNDLVGATVTTRSTNSFTLGFTAATLTAQTIEGAVIHR